MTRIRKGFTLIELLVVVLIIAILASIALPLYLSATRDATKRAARSNMRAIATAEQAYKVKNLDYTTTLSDLSPDLGRDYGNQTNFAGPGNRYYTVTKIAADGTADCDVNGDNDTNAAPASPPTVSNGSIKITSSATNPSDGCYIPGVSTK